MEKQIKETYYKAFLNLLEEKTAASPPDYEWITRLYIEIKQRLKNLLKSNHPLALEMDEKLDSQLFKQMIENNAFSGTDFYNLICYVFELCLKLGSPARDEEVQRKKEIILKQMQAGGTFAKIVPLFILYANESIDLIYEDLGTLNDSLNDSSSQTK
jgi:hypothetical protein